MSKGNFYWKELLYYLYNSNEFVHGTFIPLVDGRIAYELSEMHVSYSSINKGFLLKNAKFGSILFREEDLEWTTIQAAFARQNSKIVDQTKVNARVGKDNLAFYMSPYKCLKEEFLPFYITSKNELIVLATEPKDKQQIVNFTKNRINPLKEKELKEEKLKTLEELEERLNKLKLADIHIELCPQLAFFYAVVNNCSILAHRQIIAGI